MPRNHYGVIAVLFAIMLWLQGCQKQAEVKPVVPASAIPATPAPQAAQNKVMEAPPLRVPLPRFEDYPAEPIFAGKPAKVNLASHPDARMFRTRLTAPFENESRFAGHYRIVVIGCGTSCRSIWAVDLISGAVFSLFTASYGVKFQPDSRLIVMNEPAEYEALLNEMSVAEVEDLMKTYGAPEYWLEEQGKFKRIGPTTLEIDPASKKIVAK